MKLKAMQMDLFGNEISLQELEKREIRLNKGNKYRSMQEMYGTIEGKQCKTCKNLMSVDYHNRTYYKCQLWFLSHSKATDIRLKDKACRKYEED